MPLEGFEPTISASQLPQASCFNIKLASFNIIKHVIIDEILMYPY